MTANSVIDLAGLAEVSPFQTAPRRSPRLAKRSPPPNKSEYPLFTGFINSGLGKDMLINGRTSAIKKAPILGPINAKITRRRNNATAILWDPDDFNKQREPTWAPRMPRRGVSGMPAASTTVTNNTLTKGGSFKKVLTSKASPTVPCPNVLGETAEEVMVEKHQEQQMSNVIHTDPTHKRDIVIKEVAFGWGNR